eukprot:jgi/Picsp_1/3462/NSC_06300-R1_delayed flowering1
MCDQDLHLRFDWDELLQTCALDVQQAPENVKDVELGTIARALGRTSSIDKLPQSILKGEDVLPELRAAKLCDVLDQVISKNGEGHSGEQGNGLNVMQCINLWAQSQQTPTHSGNIMSNAYINQPFPSTALQTAANAVHGGGPVMVPLSAGLVHPAPGGVDLLSTLLPGVQKNADETFMLGPMMNSVPLTGTNAQRPGEVHESLMQRQEAAALRAARQKKRKEKQQQSDIRRKMSAQSVDDDGFERIDVTAMSGPASNGTTQDTSQDDAGAVSKGRKGKRAARADPRAIRNRESAARSRAKRLEYTSTLEKRVQSLRDENKSLRTKIIEAAKAPADPYAGKLDGKPLRRTRTMPL